MSKTHLFKKHLLLMVLALLPFFQINAFAQDDLDKRVKELEDKLKESSKFKLSGFVQAQFTNTEVNNYTHGSASGYFPASKNAFELLKGRLKGEYRTDLLGAVIDVEATTTYVAIRDAFVDFKEPFTKWVTLRAGLTKLMMGTEILYSPAEILSPTASKITRTLLPKDRDISAMLIVKAPANHFLNPFTLNLQLANGNGLNPANTNHKNFVARLNYTNTFGDLKLGVGASTYQGGVYQGTHNVYTMDGSQFVVDSSADNVGKFASRTYYQCEVVASYKSPAGLTFLSGEFWRGDQPGSAISNATPQTIDPSISSTPSLYIGDTYIRPFKGIIALLSHEIVKTGLTVAVKYDTYNPNTKISGDDIKSAGDISYDIIGAGLIYEPPIAKKNLRFTLWYDMISNETSNNLVGYDKDIKDNILTLRMQVKF